MRVAIPIRVSPLAEKWNDDLGAEDWTFPDARELTPPEVIRLWTLLDMAGTEANKRAARLKERRSAVKELALKVLDASGQTSARAKVDEAQGREIQITPYDWEAFNIKDPEAFQAWAAEYADEGGEQFYDSSPKLREGIFQDAMRELSQNNQPIPPGVVRFPDVRISRTAVPVKRRKKK